MVKSVIKKLGVYKISLSVDENTTHVVCGDNRRTMNVLKGISCGCWIVSVEWVSLALLLISDSMLFYGVACAVTVLCLFLPCKSC